MYELLTSQRTRDHVQNSAVTTRSQARFVTLRWAPGSKVSTRQGSWGGSWVQSLSTKTNCGLLFAVFSTQIKSLMMVTQTGKMISYFFAGTQKILVYLAWRSPIRGPRGIAHNLRRSNGEKVGINKLPSTVFESKLCSS